MPQLSSAEITRLLQEWRAGDESALARLMPKVYRRLKEIAGHLMRAESASHTLDATALVHEAYLRLTQLDGMSWHHRAHFFAMCARLMRRILVDHARHHSRDKRGGDLRRVELTELEVLSDGRGPELVALDGALDELADHDAEMAQIVELRFFGGLDREEIAEVMCISSATVTRRWRTARAWLGRRLGSEDG